MNFEDSARLARSLPESLGPLAVDIDGTLTDEDLALDPRVFPLLRAWPAPLVIATGKSMPYPIALCEFLGIEPRVIAENGGVVLSGRDNRLEFHGDREAVRAVADEYRSRGHSLGWEVSDLVNRWRETELAVSRESPLEPLEAIASDHGMMVVDTEYAYHVKSPSVDKGVSLATLAVQLEHSPDEFTFIGDSANDVPGFEAVGTGIAVANAAEMAKAKADHVTDGSYASGFLDAVALLADRTRS